MAESQSRFSIIEELVKKKSEADNQINQKLTAIADEKLKHERTVEDTNQELARRGVDLNARADQYTREIASLKEQKAEYQKAIDAITQMSAQPKA